MNNAEFDELKKLVIGDNTTSPKFPRFLFIMAGVENFIKPEHRAIIFSEKQKVTGTEETLSLGGLFAGMQYVDFREVTEVEKGWYQQVAKVCLMTMKSMLGKPPLDPTPISEKDRTAFDGLEGGGRLLGLMI